MVSPGLGLKEENTIRMPEVIHNPIQFLLNVLVDPNECTLMKFASHFSIERTKSRAEQRKHVKCPIKVACNMLKVP